MCEFSPLIQREEGGDEGKVLWVTGGGIIYSHESTTRVESPVQATQILANGNEKVSGGKVLDRIGSSNVYASPSMRPFREFPRDWFLYTFKLQ